MLRCRDGCLAALTLWLVIAARPATAQSISGPPLNTQARAHFDKALAAYSAANYRAASVEFELAYGLDARRELLFAWAQAERLSGNCDRAVMLYRRFLDQSPTEAEAAKAVRQIDRCKPADPAEPASPPATTPGDDIAVERPPPPRVVEHATVESHWYSDPWVDGLVAGGGAAAVAGGIFLWLAHTDDDSAGRATQYGDARRLADEADSRRLIGTITLATGGALVVGGLALSWWNNDHDATVARSWSPQIGPGTVGVAGVF